MICQKKLFRFFSSLRSDELTKSAFILAAAGLIAKGIGAIYRVLLTATVGVEALGVYQTVFPLYCVLLTFSSTGVPSGISKLVAEGENSKKLGYKSIILFGGIGVVGSFAMFFLSEPLALMQGEGAASLSYKCLSPSVFLVSVISCLRGIFQGKMNMVPTALSQVIEQVVKTVAGVSLSFLGSSYIEKAALAALAVTLSEVFALLYLLFVSQKSSIPGSNTDFPSVLNKVLPLAVVNRCRDLSYYKKILFVVLPVTLSALSLPLLRTTDSFTVVNVLKQNFEDATSLYGLYSGGAESVVSLPVSICYGIAAAAVPLLSREKSFDNVKKILTRTFVASAFFSLVLVLFAPLAVNVLFYSLSGGYKFVLVNLLRFSCLNVFLLSMIQSLSAVLIAYGKSLVAFLSVLFTLPLKLFLNFFLVGNPSIGVYGCAFSDTACYFVAGLMILLYIIRRNSKASL